LARANAAELKAPDRPKAVRRSTEKRKKQGGRPNGHAKSVVAILSFIFLPEHLYVRRLRAGGRNIRGENSSDESEEEHFDSDNSVGDIEDHPSDSAVGRSSLNSGDDLPENRRPGRDARTRANVILLFFSIAYEVMLTSELGKNKKTCAKEVREKRLRHRNSVYLCVPRICGRIYL